MQKMVMQNFGFRREKFSRVSNFFHQIGKEFSFDHVIAMIGEWKIHHTE